MRALSHKVRLLKDLAALVAGVLIPFAFSPFQVAPLAFLSLAVLFFVWLDAGPVRSALRGFLFGLGQFAVGVHWIHVTLHDYAGSTDLAAFILAAFCVILLAGFPALAGLISALISPHSRAIRLLLVNPGAWVLCEWLRAWFEFPGFPWLQVGYSQLETIPGALAPILGVYGVGFFVAFSVGALLYGLKSIGSARRIVLLLLLTTWTIAAIFQQVQWTVPVGPPLKVSLLQGNIPQHVKWLPTAKKKTLRWYIDETRNHWNSDLIVWPETAVPVSYHKVQPLFDELGVEAVRHHSGLLVGVPVFDPQNRRTYNGVVTVGASQGRYLKRHLVPFGEYLPFQPVSGYIAQFMDFQKSNFSPGAPQQPPVKAAGLPVAISICYEDVFGQETLAAMPDALFLVNVTNDGWFGNSIALDQNLQMARMRSLETGRYMIRAANTGLTGIISPLGDIVKIARPFEATVLTGEIQPMRGITPYMLVGDFLVMVFVGVGLLIAWACQRHPPVA